MNTIKTRTGKIKLGGTKSFYKDNIAMSAIQETLLKAENAMKHCERLILGKQCAGEYITVTYVCDSDEVLWRYKSYW